MTGGIRRGRGAARRAEGTRTSPPTPTGGTALRLWLDAPLRRVEVAHASW